MAKTADHPMDAFPVRPLTFDIEAIALQEPIWSRTSPKFALFINALGVHVPYFERYLIATMRQARSHVSDPDLQKDMASIIGQEAHHAKNFVHVNALLAKRYPKVAGFEQDAKAYFARHAEQDSLKQMVGFTAGYETFTFLAGLIILDNYDEWLADSDPVMKAMWVWHQVEEVEHGGVAFNLYKSLYGDDELYRKWMIVRALTHIARDTVRGYVHMARVEGWLRRPLEAASSLFFCGRLLMQLLVNALPVFRKNYHPRRHPRVTTRQNPIQLAWRKFYSEGGDVLAIDRDRMARMMDLTPQATR